MKGLRKYLTPFAPDQSGAVSVLYELGGITVICDAGGCAGNVCGFDEPRWFERSSAVFSAGLRDMDAIMGRDQQLVSKLVDVCSKVDANFAAIVGTPVPSVIGTDYYALKRMTERKVNIPVLAINTNGMELYDKGASKAYEELVRTFCREQYQTEQGRIGLWGVNPLDVSRLDADKLLKKELVREGFTKIECYGMGVGLEELKTASACEKNIVVAPSGYPAARLMNELYDIPFEIRNPLALYDLQMERLKKSPAKNQYHRMEFIGKRVLVCDQQVNANTIAQYLTEMGAEVTTATWFLSLKEIDAAFGERRTISLKEEDDFIDLVKEEHFDLVIGDPALWQMIPFFNGETMNIHQFAVSGSLQKVEERYL